jgi:hypothetical protein
MNPSHFTWNLEFANCQPTKLFNFANIGDVWVWDFFVFFLNLFKITNTEEKRKCNNYVWEDELN